jgi:signal transduction histidine kinase
LSQPFAVKPGFVVDSSPPDRRRHGLIPRLARALRGLAQKLDPEVDPTRRAHERANLAESRLRTAIEALPEGVVFLDAEGRYVLWNQRYAEIYHRSADLFAPGRRLADTLAIGVARGDYPDAIGREEDWIAERLAMMDNPGSRHEQLLSDGRWILIEERRTADGGLIGIRVDITELKEQAERLRHALAQAELANKAKIQFLSNMSHEIRTPLNGVLGLAHVLSRTSLDAQQGRLVGTIIESAVLLERLLSDVLDIARIESGRLELRQEVFALESLARDTLANFEPQAADKGLRMALDVAPDACGPVSGDPVRLRQVLGNLIGNAVKFTAEGHVSVEVRRVDDQVAEFRVADTGIGFPPQEAERLFERFVQADGSITRQFGGSGLGLAICRDLVEMMGGRIGATGRPGKGAEFRVTVPLPRVDQRLGDAPMTAA